MFVEKIPPPRMLGFSSSRSKRQCDPSNVFITTSLGRPVCGINGRTQNFRHFGYGFGDNHFSYTEWGNVTLSSWQIHWSFITLRGRTSVIGISLNSNWSLDVDGPIEFDSRTARKDYMLNHSMFTAHTLDILCHGLGMLSEGWRTFATKWTKGLRMDWTE